MNLQTITIREYLTRKDINFRDSNGELITHCLFNGCDNDSREGEAHLYFNNKTGQYECKKCGEKGNLITLAKHFGDDINEIALKPRISTIKLTGTKFDAELVETCHQTLPTNIRQYLNARGISNAVIDNYKLGWGKFYGKNWIAIPIPDINGAYRYFKLRLDPNAGDDKITFPKGEEAQIYGWDLLLNTTDKIIICEGELDRLALLSRNILAITSTHGAMTFKKEWMKHFKKVSNIFICYDNDDTGRKGSERVAKMLAEISRPSIYKITLPQEVGEGGDITDFFVKLNGNPDDLFGKYAKKYQENIYIPQNRHSSLLAQSTDEKWDSPVPLYNFSPPDFPIDSLPIWLRNFVDGLAEETQTPIDLPALLVLAVCAGAIAKIVRIQLWPGYQEPVNIYIVVLLPPGNRKSSVFSEVVAPVVHEEEIMTKHATLGIADAMNRLKIAELELKQKQERAAKEKQSDQRNTLLLEATAIKQNLDKVKVPAQPRLIADDITSERLSMLLQEQNGRIMILSAEGDNFDVLAGRYSANAIPNFGVYLKSHCGDPIRVDRVGRSPEFVKSPALTIGVTVQPEVIHGLFRNPVYRGRGLLGRFLYSIPKSPLGNRLIAPKCMSNTVRIEYQNKLKLLLNLPLKSDKCEMLEYVLHLEPDAIIGIQKFAEEIEPKLAPFGDLGNITDWAGKLVGAVGRIGAILHMAENADRTEPWNIPVTIKTIENAIRIGRYLIPHAQAAYQLMGSDKSIEDARYLLDVIRNKNLEFFSRRDIYNLSRSRFQSVKNIDPALHILCEHNFIRQYPETQHSGVGRKPSHRYDVNPKWHNLDAQNTRKHPEVVSSADIAYSAKGGNGTIAPNDNVEVNILDGSI